MLLMPALLTAEAIAQPGGPLVLERHGRVISLEPYAPNILRVTMSVDRASATSAVQPKCPIYSADAHRDLQSNRTRPIDGNATPIWQSRRRGVFDVDPLDR